MKSFLSFIFIDRDSEIYTQFGNLKEIKILYSNNNNFEDEDLILNMANVWQIHIGSFNPEKSQASKYNISIKKEKAVIDSIFNQEIHFNENIKVDFQNCFNEAQKK